MTILLSSRATEETHRPRAGKPSSLLIDVDDRIFNVTAIQATLALKPEA